MLSNHSIRTFKPSNQTYQTLFFQGIKFSGYWAYEVQLYIWKRYQDINKLHLIGVMTVLFKIAYAPYVAVAITAKIQGIQTPYLVYTEDMWRIKAYLIWPILCKFNKHFIVTVLDESGYDEYDLCLYCYTRFDISS
jgi:hypothetical protein